MVLFETNYNLQEGLSLKTMNGVNDGNIKKTKYKKEAKGDYKTYVRIFCISKLF